MIYERLRVFVSSRMQELWPEREAMRDALAELNIDGWIFEEDAGARPHGIQQTYKEEIDNADLYIGLFWRGYGDYTIDEFNYATERNKDRLIYEKRADIEGQRDPKLQTFLDRIGKVETGLTARWFNTTEEMREGVKQDAARWQTQKIRDLRQLNASYKSTPLEAGEQRDLKILLGKVSHFWVEGILDGTIRRASLLDLGKDTQPAAVGNPWEAVIELPFEGARAVASGKSISDVFDDLEQSVLILGQPGSGKTTTLLTLVRDLVARAERNAAQPIPVVFHLSSWIDPQQPLDVWLANELSDKYQIPKKIGKDWLDRHRLLPLLDGLDEVSHDHRAAGVTAINHFAKEIGLPGMVVCCRLEQYEELKVKLALNGAICLRPLTDSQIDSYVQEAGPELAGLRTALQQESGLQEIARSPLMLNLMCLAYRGYGAENLAGHERSEDRTRHLFTTYIDLMFKKRGTAELAFPREQSLGFLSWIARRLCERNRAMFLMEDLQPSWLANGAQRWAYVAALSLVLGLLVGLVNIVYWQPSMTPTGLQGWREAVVWLTAMPLWFVAFGSLEGFLDRLPPGIARGAGKTLLSAALLFLVSAVAMVLLSTTTLPTKAQATVVHHLLWAGLGIVFVVGAMGRNRNSNYSIETVESLRWAFGNAWQGALLGFLGGLVVGSVIYWPGLASFGPKNLLIVPIGMAAFGIALGATLGGLTPRVIDAKTLPNQGIRLSLRMATVVALNACWLVLFVMILYQIAGKAPPNIPGWGLLGLSFFTAIFATLFLWFGGFDVLKHYVLRTVLSATRQTPWNLARFLEQARALNLMQRAGSAYIFVHRRLLEHLAN